MMLCNCRRSPWFDFSSYFTNYPLYLFILDQLSHAMMVHSTALFHSNN